ncbi:MAG: hypothetical protein U0401_01535 [Anaerolineae bacterium]
MNESNWWNPDFRYRLPVTLFDTLGAGRVDEPVRLDLVFDVARPHPNGLWLTGSEGQLIPFQVVKQGLGADGKLDFASLCFLATVRRNDPSQRCYVYLSESDPGSVNFEGIQRLEPHLADGFRRLDTGHYVLELCRGTAQGHGGSKWGIRHFEAKAQGVNLIAGNMNAFGGVYGPFFTPENGLVNPPAHQIAEIEPLTEGPITCQYRMKVNVRDGLRPELRGKTIEILWSFYWRSPWFVRTYLVDDYETTIDGRPCRNRITVGDEIESGKSNLLLSTYRHHDGTRYRAGDLYAEILLARLKDLQARNPEAVSAAMAKLGNDPNEDPAAWHWDNYWRMFCVLEGALPRDVLEGEVERIWRSANEIVWSDKEHNLMKYTDDAVDVNREPQQTIFPLNAQKTCEYSPLTGYAFVRFVNRLVPRMQIVQRYDSGWVNWGTNGENEYPEMPIGSTIWSAYGRFDNWQAEANRMETPLAVAVNAIERIY